MTPNYTTIITPIAAERVEVLRQYLRDHAEPRAGCGPDLVKCGPLFRFDQVKGLHFCSFIILCGDEAFDPYLVFEATFDGPRADFLRELWRVAGVGMHAVYDHCVGYPQSGLAVPELIEEYLVRHDVGAHTFFSGSPGRSVAQIQGESRIRHDMVTFLAGRRGADDPTPATSANLQQAVQRDFIRGRCENRWAEGAAVMPWEMTNRVWVACAVGLALLVVACGVGAVAIRWIFGVGPRAMRDGFEWLFDWLRQVGVELINSPTLGLLWLSDLMYALQLPALHVVLVLAGMWVIVRVFELFMRSRDVDPRSHIFVLRYLLQIAVIVRYALAILLVLFAALQLATVDTPDAGLQQTSPVKALVQKLDQAFTGTEAASLWASAVLLVGAGAIWALLNHWATSLKLAVQFQELAPHAENRRRFVVDVLRFLQIIVLVIAGHILARHIPDQVRRDLAAFARPQILRLLVIAAYTLAGIAVVYAGGFVLFCLVRALELGDRLAFKSAADLTKQALNNEPKYAREEGGINRYQNHLASLTYVKPGFLRRWFLRITLFLINLLSRYWFNQGDLGGIPTILSARWVLIDGGRRLLFLDNYTGAWESYLNEFIDMGAVKGLNAIWTNTFVKTAGEKEYAWPETKFYLWYGAQAERPFKAYVRQSQVETLVWYGAYPTLSITNINTNTQLRQSLFRPLASCDLDSVIQRL